MYNTMNNVSDNARLRKADRICTDTRNQVDIVHFEFFINVDLLGTLFSITLVLVF